MLKSNYLIINRKPYPFSEMRVEGRTMTFVDAGNQTIECGILPLDDKVYAALYCDEVCNVTLVDDRDGVQTVETILWCNDSDFQSGKQTIELALGHDMSRQNRKINRYGEELAKKLAIGIELHVIDAVEESAMVTCPCCGMMSPRGTEYCMDCGEELPQ